MADSKDSLPDISGVFNIDESRIPTKIIAKPEEKKQQQPQQQQQSILLRPETRKEEKQQEKAQKQAVKIKRKEAKKKALKQKLALGGVALLVVLALALVVRAAILDRRKPVVAVTETAVGTLTSRYDTEGSVLSETKENGDISLFVVFVENDYDVYGLQKGQRAEITVSEEVTVPGVVADIRKEESDSSILSRLIAVFSGATFSTASNYVVVISPDDDTLLPDNTPVKITVTTGIAQDVLYVPAAAVHKDEEQQHYVWVYKKLGKKLKRQDVSVGLTADGFTEIKKGLGKETFVVSDVLGDNLNLHDNVKVKLSTDD